jgi:hypothetical protein
MGWLRSHQDKHDNEDLGVMHWLFLAASAYPIDAHGRI